MSPSTLRYFWLSLNPLLVAPPLSYFTKSRKLKQNPNTLMKTDQAFHFITSFTDGVPLFLSSNPPLSLLVSTRYSQFPHSVRSKLTLRIRTYFTRNGDTLYMYSVGMEEVYGVILNTFLFEQTQGKCRKRSVCACACVRARVHLDRVLSGNDSTCRWA